MPGEQRPFIRSPGAIDPDVVRPAPTTAPRPSWNEPTEAESAAKAALETGIPQGHYLGLAAGERLELCDRLQLETRTRQAIFVGGGEMVVLDTVHGWGRRHYSLPDNPSTKHAPLVATVVVTVIHEKPIGHKRLGNHFLEFLGPTGALVGRMDNSIDYGANSAGTWEFSYDDLHAMCNAVGVGCRLEIFDTAKEFMAARPDHLRTERVREWGLAAAIGIPIAVGFGVAGTFLALVGPVGVAVGVLEAIGVVVAIALTAWGHSRWRMRRALRRES
jgi:hypothetical protein